MGQKINSNLLRVNSSAASNFIYQVPRQRLLPDVISQEQNLKDFLMLFFYQYKILIDNVVVLRTARSCFVSFEIFSTLGSRQTVVHSSSSGNISLKNIPFSLLSKASRNRDKRIWMIKYLKKKQQRFLYFFAEKFLQSIAKYLGENVNTSLIFKGKIRSTIQANEAFFFKSLKKKLLKLKKFFKASFFKNSANVICQAIRKPSSAAFLSKYLASQIAKLKRHNFFFNFLRKILASLVASSFSILKGIKIIIKGRLNGKPRASHVIFHAGKVSIQTIQSNINYSDSTAFSLYGTFGVKVWCSTNI